MNHVKTVIFTLACVATFGLVLQGEVPSLMADDRPDIGLVDTEEVPADKGDILVVYSAKWCGPCQASRPQWTLLRGQGYKVVYIDIDDPYDHVGQFDYVTTEIVDKAMEKRPNAVPTLRYYNSHTEKFVGKPLTGMQTLPKIKERLWKTQSLPVLVPELRR